MKENYIKDLEIYKRSIACNENVSKEEKEHYEQCYNVAKNISIFELESIHYLRLIDDDGSEYLDFFKELYKIKTELKNAVLSHFKIFSLVEPFNYENMNEE